MIIDCEPDKGPPKGLFAPSYLVSYGSSWGVRISRPSPLGSLAPNSDAQICALFLIAGPGSSLARSSTIFVEPCVQVCMCGCVQVHALLAITAARKQEPPILHFHGTVPTTAPRIYLIYIGSEAGGHLHLVIKILPSVDEFKICLYLW